MENLNRDKIEEFYNNWPYPDLNIYKLSDLVANGFRDKSDPSINWNKFFGDRDRTQNIDILVAGCGTVQAGLIAFRNRNSNVIGIDISEKSIEIQNKLCKDESLDNVHLQVSSILDYTENKKFDLIICSGVLHHTVDPLENLKKLARLLKKDGVLSLMIYNESIRQGVYKIKKLITLLNLETNIKNAKVISDLLYNIPNHTVNKYIQENSELQHLNNFMDTFFNPREIAFNPINLKDLIINTDLIFKCWLTDNYNIEKRLTKENPLFEKIKSLNIFEQAYCIDLIKEDKATIDIVLQKQ